MSDLEELGDHSSSLSAVISTHQPSLDEISDVIRTALEENFQESVVDVTDCPDLSEPPFSMTSRHFGSNLRIAEIGGPGNLFPLINKHKSFHLGDICSTCDAPSAFVFGPGAGPWPIVGVNCEMVADANIKEQKFATKIARLDSSTSTGYIQEKISVPTFSLMGNLAVSDADTPSKVVHFKCSVRRGETNLPETIRRAVAAKYGDNLFIHSGPVSLAGIFVLVEGEAKLHVMPDFPGCPWENTKEIDQWLRYFTMKAPLVCATVIHSYDPGHKLRMEHTHCYSKHGDAGHYHYDVTPETVIYEGWMAVAEKIYRIDEI